MGFKNYSSNNDKSINDKNNFSENETKKVEELYNEYKDKSEDELLSELFKNVEKQKSNGTFNYQSLEKTVNQLTPFLTYEQNLKLKDLLNKLKK